jgi:hypothetical protein
LFSKNIIKFGLDIFCLFLCNQVRKHRIGINTTADIFYSRMSRFVPSLLFNGYWGLLSPGIRWPGHEGDHSPPSVAEIISEWSYTCVPRLCPHVIGRDIFTFTLIDRVEPTL